MKRHFAANASGQANASLQKAIGEMETKKERAEAAFSRLLEHLAPLGDGASEKEALARDKSAIIFAGYFMRLDGYRGVASGIESCIRKESGAERPEKEIEIDTDMAGNSWLFWEKMERTCIEAEGRISEMKRGEVPSEEEASRGRAHLATLIISSVDAALSQMLFEIENILGAIAGRMKTNDPKIANLIEKLGTIRRCHWKMKSGEMVFQGTEQIADMKTLREDLWPVAQHIYGTTLFAITNSIASTLRDFQGDDSERLRIEKLGSKVKVLSDTIIGEMKLGRVGDMAALVLSGSLWED